MGIIMNGHEDDNKQEKTLDKISRLNKWVAWFCTIVSAAALYHLTENTNHYHKYNANADGWAIAESGAPLVVGGEKVKADSATSLLGQFHQLATVGLFMASCLETLSGHAPPDTAIDPERASNSSSITSQDRSDQMKMLEALWVDHGLVETVDDGDASTSHKHSKSHHRHHHH